MENIITKITDMDFNLECNELNNPKLRIGARGIAVRSDEKIALFNKLQNNFKQISHIFVANVFNDTKQLELTQKEQDEGAKN